MALYVRDESDKPITKVRKQDGIPGPSDGIPIGVWHVLRPRFSVAPAVEGLDGVSVWC